MDFLVQKEELERVSSCDIVVDCTMFCRCMLYVVVYCLLCCIYTLLILYGMYWFTLYHNIITSHLVCHHTALRAAL